MKTAVSFINMFPVLGGIYTIALAQCTEGKRYRQAVCYHQGVYSVYWEALNRDMLVKLSVDDKQCANDIVLIDAIVSQ